MLEIRNIADNPERIDECIKFFWEEWGNKENYNFYKDCMLHSVSDRQQLPSFYIGLIEDEIVASYALLNNDLISRQDLLPWLACLFVKEEYRSKGIAAQLLEHTLVEAKRLGYKKVYLSTDLVGFYEKKMWQYLTEAYNFSGTAFKVYEKAVPID